MTWENLVSEWRVHLQEAGSHTQLLKSALVKIADDGDGPGEGETLLLLTVLTTTIDRIHGACASIAIGVDALASLRREEMGKDRPMQRVGDVAQAGGSLTGNLVSIRELVGVEFIITGIQDWRGRGRESLTVQIEQDGENAFFFTSIPRICTKLLKCVGKLPLLATITEETASTSGQTYLDIH